MFQLCLFSSSTDRLFYRISLSLARSLSICNKSLTISAHNTASYTFEPSARDVKVSPVDGNHHHHHHHHHHRNHRQEQEAARDHQSIGVASKPLPFTIDALAATDSSSSSSSSTSSSPALSRRSSPAPSSVGGDASRGNSPAPIKRERRHSRAGSSCGSSTGQRSPRSRSRSRSRSCSRASLSPACSELSPGRAPDPRARSPQIGSATSAAAGVGSMNTAADQQQRQFADAMNVINAAMAKAAAANHSTQTATAGQQHHQQPNDLHQQVKQPEAYRSSHSSSGTNKLISSHQQIPQQQQQQQQQVPNLPNLPNLPPLPPQQATSAQSQQDAAMAAAMAATNSFLYAGLSPAAAALLPRLYAANSFLASGRPHATPTSTAAGLLATVPQMSGRSPGLGPLAPGPQCSPPDSSSAAAANFMLAADPSLWAALASGAAGGFGSPFGAAGCPPGSSSGDLLAQTAQLMAQQQQLHGPRHGPATASSSTTPM